MCFWPKLPGVFSQGLYEDLTAIVPFAREDGFMKRVKPGLGALSVGLILFGQLMLLGCQNTPVDVSDLTQGPAPLREPGKTGNQANCCYEDSLKGHEVFDMYCSSCHNARSLAERPFSNYQNAAQHMRVRANLTGEEYAKLMAFLRRWQDVPAPGQSETLAPNRFVFSQPLNELRQQLPKTASDLQGGPRPGSTSEASPGQPPPGSSPQEAR
jgi:hypothetical protein